MNTITTVAIQAVEGGYIVQYGVDGMQHTKIFVKEAHVLKWLRANYFGLSNAAKSDE